MLGDYLFLKFVMNPSLACPMESTSRPSMHPQPWECHLEVSPCLMTHTSSQALSHATPTHPLEGREFCVLEDFQAEARQPRNWDDAEEVIQARG